MGQAVSDCFKCFQPATPDFESNFVKISSEVKGEHIKVDGIRVSGRGCAVCVTSMLQTRCYFEVTVVRPGEFSVGVTNTVKTGLNTPLSQRPCTWSADFTHKLPKGTVIGIVYDLSSVRPTLSFLQDGVAVPNSTITSASGEVFPILYLSGAVLDVNLGTHDFQHLPSGFDGLMCSVDLL